MSSKTTRNHGAYMQACEKAQKDPGYRRRKAEREEMIRALRQENAEDLEEVRERYFRDMF